MQPLKYEEEIKKLTCELEDFEERQLRTSYRWVHEDIEDGRNFLPVYLLDNTRKRKDCTGWALSMFETQDQASARLKALVSDKPNIYLKLGTHTAEGDLCASDGVSDTASKNPKTLGHFNHFEYCNCSLVENFSIIECVISV